MALILASVFYFRIYPETIVGLLAISELQVARLQ